MVVISSRLLQFKGSKGGEIKVTTTVLLPMYSTLVLEYLSDVKLIPETSLTNIFFINLFCSKFSTKTSFCVKFLFSSIVVICLRGSHVKLEGVPGSGMQPGGKLPESSPPPPNGPPQIVGGTPGS